MRRRGYEHSNEFLRDHNLLKNEFGEKRERLRGRAGLVGEGQPVSRSRLSGEAQNMKLVSMNRSMYECRTRVPSGTQAEHKCGNALSDQMKRYGWKLSGNRGKREAGGKYSLRGLDPKEHEQISFERQGCGRMAAGGISTSGIVMRPSLWRAMIAGAAAGETF